MWTRRLCTQIAIRELALWPLRWFLFCFKHTKWISTHLFINQLSHFTGDLFFNTRTSFKWTKGGSDQHQAMQEMSWIVTITSNSALLPFVLSIIFLCPAHLCKRSLFICKDTLNFTQLLVIYQTLDFDSSRKASFQHCELTPFFVLQ